MQNENNPIPDCPYCLHKFPKKGCVKNGFFNATSSNKKRPRYKCNNCSRTFSLNTTKDIYRQHKPEINESILNFSASGVSQNRLAINLKCQPKTISKKMNLLAFNARKIHDQKLGKGDFAISSVLFDSIKTFEHTLMKPILVVFAIAINFDNKNKKYETGVLIDAVAKPMGYEDKYKRKANKKYGIRKDLSIEAKIAVMKSIKKASIKPDIEVIVEVKNAYGTFFNDIMPDCERSVITRSEDGNEAALEEIKKQQLSRLSIVPCCDCYFPANYLLAKLQKDIGRLNKNTWMTTKSIHGLQNQLDLYIDFFNKNYLLKKHKQSNHKK